MTCGTGKYPFPSYKTASNAAHRTTKTNRLRGRTTPKVYPFHCHECGYTHLTGNSQPKIRSTK